MPFASHGQFGHCSFLRAYDTLPMLRADRVRAISRWLDVSERTVSAWVSGSREPPRAAVYALWLESGAGHAYTHHLIDHERHWLQSHVNSLSDVVASQQATIDALRRENSELRASQRGPLSASNDAAFDDVPRPPHAPHLAHRPRPQYNWYRA